MCRQTQLPNNTSNPFYNSPSFTDLYTYLLTYLEHNEVIVINVSIDMTTVNKWTNSLHGLYIFYSKHSVA